MGAALLFCPVRGTLTAPALATDGLTQSEEARRIDFLHFLIDDRDYPVANIHVETVVLKNLGHDGKNSLRADVIVYDQPKKAMVKLPLEDRLPHIVLVAEIKREAKSKAKGVARQLEPALRQMPSTKTLGVYWDDEHRDLYYKQLVEEPTQHLVVRSDTVANLPRWGQEYRTKAITVETLTAPTNLVNALFELANIMRSNGVNDEELRYRETARGRGRQRGGRMTLLLPSSLPFGDLVIEETWLSFDGPRLFVARNKTGQSFIFNAIDEDEETISYLAVGTSDQRRAMVRSGGLGLRAAFTLPEAAVFRVVCDYGTGDVRTEVVDVEQLSDGDLPTEDAYVSVPTETLPSFDPNTLAARATAEGRTLVALRLNPPTLARSEWPSGPCERPQLPERSVLVEHPVEI